MDGLFSGINNLKLDASSLFNDDSDVEANEPVEEPKPKFPERKPIQYTPTANDSDSLPGFDLTAGNEWQYPSTVEMRAYQFSIAERCLYQNCLVCIPTGLGKTLIAAVVMHNFLRWYPTGCVVFMAPTRPLVSQQMVACRNLTGLSIAGKRPGDAIELTGTTSPQQRAALWNGSYRAFFLTPQVIANDLVSGICPASSIRCIVIDEAHKATGNHAYCQVMRAITGEPYNHRQFRVVALSATPASDLQGAQAVIANLLVAHLEVRSEDSPDVRAFCHQRAIESVVVRLDPRLSALRARLCDFARPPLTRLRDRGALWSSPDPAKLAPFALLKAREAFTQTNRFSPFMPAVLQDFRVASAFARAIQLLTQYGLKPVHQFLTSNTDLGDIEGLSEFVGEIGSTLSQADGVGGHPKLLKLRELLVEHFSSSTCLSQRGTRAIVFTQFRDSVADIMDILKAHSPLLKPAVFVGQSADGRNDSRRKKTTQRDQLEVMEAFREGRVNILVSTSVGEEGLDVGQVDLIVCFDAHKSPARLIQRLGRTGRKRNGRVVVLLTEGKEQANFSLSMARSSSVHTTLLQGQATRQLAFYPHNPRMVPLGVNPVPVLWKPPEYPDEPTETRNRRSLADFKRRYSVALEGLNFSPCQKSALLSIGESGGDETFTQRYSANRHIAVIREGFQSDTTGPSTTTWHLVSSLRLVELHRRGQTHAMYHATGLRKVDMTTPLSELLPSQLTQADPPPPSPPVASTSKSPPKSSPEELPFRFVRGLVSKKLMLDPRFDLTKLPKIVSLESITLESLNEALAKMLATAEALDSPQKEEESASVVFDSAFGLPAPVKARSSCVSTPENEPPAKRQRTVVESSGDNLALKFDKTLRFSEDLDNLLS